MSKRDEENKTEWTISTLKHYIDMRFEAVEKAVTVARDADQKAVDHRQSQLDKEFHEHLEQVRHENSLAFTVSDKAIQAALASAKEAVDKAEANTEKRFDAANGFRAQLAAQASTFMTRAEANAISQRTSERVDDLTDRMNRADGAARGVHSTGSAIAAGLAALTSVAAIVISILILVGR